MTRHRVASTLRWVIMLGIVHSGTTSGQSVPFSIPFSADTVNQVDSTGRKQGWWVNEITQRVPDTDTTETTLSLGRYTDDIKTGNWVEYYMGNGRIAFEATYVDGESIQSSTFDPNGRIIENDTIELSTGTRTHSQYFVDGRLSAQYIQSPTWIKSTWYFESGQVSRHWEHSAEPRSDETWEMVDYYPDGTLYQMEHYLGSGRLRHGTSSRYYRSGQLQYTCEYQFGKLQGEYKKYDEDGMLLEVMMWVDGVRHW